MGKDKRKNILKSKGKEEKLPALVCWLVDDGLWPSSFGIKTKAIERKKNCLIEQ